MNKMRILAGGPGPAPGSGTVWGHEHHDLDVDSYPFQGGLCGRFLNTFCSSFATCAYFICSCWLLRDCIGGLRDYDHGPPPPPAPRPSSRPWALDPPQPPLDMHGPPGYPPPPGPPGAQVGRPFY